MVLDKQGSDNRGSTEINFLIIIYYLHKSTKIYEVQYSLALTTYGQNRNQLVAHTIIDIAG